MDLRKDAGMGSIIFGGWVNEAFKTVFAPSPSAVWTFGDVEFGTHSHSTVPGWARLRLQWRDASLELMQQAKATVLHLIDEMNARSDEFRLRVTTSLRPEDGESGGYLHNMVRHMQFLLYRIFSMTARPCAGVFAWRVFALEGR